MFNVMQTGQHLWEVLAHLANIHSCLATALKNHYQADTFRYEGSENFKTMRLRTECYSITLMN